MQRARLVLIVLLVGVVPLAAIVGGAWWYFRPAPEPKTAARPRTPPPPPLKPLPVVLTAAKDLEVGNLITASDVVWAPLKNGAVQSIHMLRGKTQTADVIGAVVRRAMYKTTPLSWSAIVRPGQYGFLAAALKPNHRAVTILLNRATSQAGLIYPGDRVDVILTLKVAEEGAGKENTFTGTILEDVRVVAVNRQVESSAGAQKPAGNSSRNGVSTVTLEVLPAEAERLILATSKGNISLAMRSLTDGGRLEDRTPVAFEHLLPLPSNEVEESPPAPPPVSAVTPAPAKEVSNRVRVQIFRGGERQEVFLKE
ncbi:MAG: Flp pilus assembly protein CpaB [Deltaproteobacteria bacterium]|nr:Flp pilus assembly protein CpaB [Deltaproteobacteria bacterium]